MTGTDMEGSDSDNATEDEPETEEGKDSTDETEEYGHLLSNLNIWSSDVESESGYTTEEKDSKQKQDQDGKSESRESHNQ